MKTHSSFTGSGFTAVEVLLVCAIIAAMAGASIPTYRLYKIRSDLHLAAEQAEHALRRAQLLSQTGYQDDAWGYRPDTGTVFTGESYAERDTSLDERYPVPGGIAVSGLTEVTFSRVYGVPSAEGDIVFTAINGDQLVVSVGDDNILTGPPIPPVRIRVHFDRIKNSGHGTAEKKVFVGTGAVLYLEDEWIPLTSNGEAIVDGGLDLNVNGLSLQREEDFVRIVNYGGLESGGKEVIDATITIDRSVIDHIENEAGEHEGEQPFDGNVNDGVGGDEYILAPSKQSVQFKTRVTNAGDTILIFR